MSTISQGAGDVRARAKQGLPGQFVFSDPLKSSLTALNKDPQAVQVNTITVTGATDDITYAVTINSVLVSITSAPSSTTTTIAVQLRDAINAEPLVRGEVAATSAVADITVTGLTPGVAFTLTESDSNLTTASVSVAALADAVPFGRLVVDDGLNDSVDPQAKIAKAAGFTAQVVTQTVTFVASATYVVTIRDEAGVVIASGSTDAITNTATTATAIATTMNGLLPADSTLAAGGATFVTFTAELAGRQLTVSVGTNEEGQVGGAIGAQTDTAGPATSVNIAAVGVTLHSSNDPTLTIGGTEGVYAPNAGMRVGTKGQMWVLNTQTVTFGQTVFVELTVAADLGKFFNTDSATRVLLTGATWNKTGRLASDSINAVDINFEKPS